MKKIENLLTRIDEKDAYKNESVKTINRIKIIKTLQSILFSDCENCWQTMKKHNGKCWRKNKKHNITNKVPNGIKNNRLLKRVLFWRNENLEKEEVLVMKQIITYSKENENRKSENKMSFVEIIKNTLQHKIKYATVISVLLLTLCQVNVYAALTVGDKAVTYDANGGTFSGGTSTNEVTYSVVKELVTKISKTDNVSDDGLTADTTNGYGNNKEEVDIITIPGAEELEVTITYQTQGLYSDWVGLFDKNGIPNINNNSSAPGKAFGGKTKKTETYVVPGYTVQVYFRSDYSTCNYYGYYAVVKGVGNVIKVTSGDYMEPTKEGHGLLGWSTDSSSQTVEYELGAENVPNNEETTLYAIWKKDTVVTYNARGGFFSNRTATNTVTYNTYGKYGEESGKESEITVTNGRYKEPQYSGYTFMGWTTIIDSQTVEYPGIGDIPEVDEGTLYAVWRTPSIPLVTEWTVPANVDGSGLGTTIKLPIPAHESNSFIVDWGDGKTEKFSPLDNFPTHTYINTSKTIYTIKISGIVKYFGYNGWQDPTEGNVYKDYYTYTQYLTKLVSWGELEALRYGFSNCYYLIGSVPEPSTNSFKETISFESTFMNCNIESIPANLFTNAKKAEIFVSTFENCYLSGSIPANLFSNCTEAKYFDGVFSWATNITGSLPDGLFSKCTKAKSFVDAFFGCTGLRGDIPGNLFSGCTEVESFFRTFGQCEYLDGVISGGLFKGCAKATDFTETFTNCVNLRGDIPGDLFEGCVEATTFNATFRYCSFDGRIQEGLFSDCVKAVDFEDTFLDCSELSGNIPDYLFSNCAEATNFHGVFEGCYSLTGSIPENMFNGCTKAEDFGMAFGYCYELTGSIPEKLFSTNVNATNFSSTFGSCRGLTGTIPAGLLSNNIGVTSASGFQGTFSGCTGITGAEIDTKFIGSGMFSDCNNLTEITISNRVEEIGNTSGVFKYSGTEPPLYTILNTTNELALNYNWEGDKRTLIPLEGEEPEVFDEKALVLKFTIPVDDDGVAGEGTTLVLPVYANSRNNFTVDWGDGDIITYDSTANLPEHKYKNTEQETYTVQITGTLNQIGYNNTPVPTKTNEYKDYYTYTQYLTELLSWGELGATQYGFGCCSKMIGTIPVPSENSFVNVRNFDATFHKCSQLTGTIPENLFSNCPNVTRFLSTFYGCENLTGTIPENLFSNCPNVTSFNFLFYNCDGLTGSIPNGLFSNCPNVKSFDYTFYSCSGLSGDIPGDLFSGCSKVETFTYTFCSCLGLDGSIGEGLFEDCTSVKTFVNTFRSCQYLTGSIPEDLFANCTEVTDFENTFDWCKSLTGEIPENLFANCKKVKRFVGTFGDCSSLTGSIPENLFANCPEVTNFDDVFTWCGRLTGTIPENLFAKNPNVVSFNGTFGHCYGLDGHVSSKLFANNPNVTMDGFGFTFFWCLGLDSIELDIKYIGERMFYGSMISEFTVSDKLEQIYGSSRVFAYYGDDGYTTYPPLITTLNTNSELLWNYDWAADFRVFDIDVNTEITIPETEFTYDGSEKKMEITSVIRDGRTLTEGKDYELIYANNIGVGEARVIINGIGSYWGTIEKTFTINKRPITITAKDQIITYGEELKLDNESFIIENIVAGHKIDWVLLTPSTDIGTGTITPSMAKITSGNTDVTSNYTISYKTGNVTILPSEIYWNKALITNWTIPVNLNGAGNGTTIKLPIPAHANNNYLVDWGDGSEVEKFDSTANFPTHTYQNASETTYEVKVGGNVNQFGYTETAEISESNANQDYETFTNYLTGLIDWGEINATRYGFSRCTNLTGEIPVPELTAKTFKNVTDMSNLFYTCTGLNIEIPANLFATAYNVTSFANAFYGCENLTGTIPANLFAENAFVTNMSNVFNGCKKLTGMIPAALFNSKPLVTTYEGMFEGCEALTAGEIAIDKDEAINMDKMFKDCVGLESLVFGQFNKHLNGTAMFEGANSLRAVIMLNQALSASDIGTALDIATLGLRDGAMIYVPYISNEAIYEQAWSNIPADKIEEIVKANEPNPDYVELNGTYVDETGYSVAGFGMDETGKYTQYGFRVEIDGMPVDTSEPGSEWIVYRLFKD